MINSKNINNKDCRLYHSSKEFIGKVFSVEEKREGCLQNRSDLLIKNVYAPDGGLIFLSGENQNGEKRTTRISPIEEIILCYEGYTIFWNGKNETLYVKKLLDKFN